MRGVYSRNGTWDCLIGELAPIARRGRQAPWATSLESPGASGVPPGPDRRRWPLRPDAGQRAGAARRSSVAARPEARHGIQSAGERDAGAHHGALPAPGLRRRDSRARHAGGLPDRHRLLHALRETRARSLSPAIGARGSAAGEYPVGLLDPPPPPAPPAPQIPLAGPATPFPSP